MLVIAALLDTDFRAADLWRKWVAASEGRVHVVAHCHLSARHRYQQVPTVPSSWQRTLAPRIELLRAVVEVPGCTHIQFVSQACIPIHRPAEVVERLCVPQQSTLSLHPVPFWKVDEGSKLPDHHTVWARKISPEVWPYYVYHEQWLCLTRRHALALLAIEDDMRRWFVACDADNETDIGTGLNKLGLLGQCSREHTHFVSWPGTPARRHPSPVFRVTSAHLATYRAKGPRACFMRKVAAGCDLRAVYADLGLS